MIASGRENPLHLWAFWGAAMLEAEATWQGCTLRIWLILPLALATPLPSALSPYRWHFCPYSNWLPLGGAFFGILIGPLASLPWALCTPYILLWFISHIIFSTLVTSSFPLVNSLLLLSEPFSRPSFAWMGHSRTTPLLEHTSNHLPNMAIITAPGWGMWNFC